MSKPLSIVCVAGTRPEAVKLAPVVHELKRRSSDFRLTVMVTAQHRQMLDQMLEVFSMAPDIDLDLMRPGQSLTDVTTRVLDALQSYFAETKPDVVLAQGDTTTVMATAIACFYAQVRFGHVEAGLRTGDLRAPYPEEFNRRVAGVVADYHFAPTRRAAENLLREGTPEQRVFVTGNTVIDALQYTLRNTEAPARPLPPEAPYVLMTCHRREVFGAPIREIFNAVRDYALAHPGLYIWYPVHPNPHVLEPAQTLLGGVKNVLLTEPLDYVAFVHAMRGATLLLTDSGGVQEEAPALGKPVLVLRDTTERPEGVAAGTCRLVGPHREAITAALDELLTDASCYRAMAEARNPYGDGRAAARIAAVLRGESYAPWES